MQRIFGIFILIFITAGFSHAGDIEFTASAPASVAVGERFRITYQVNSRPSDFSAPSFAGFRTLSGPSQSSSTSVQIINNQTTRVESFSYTYELEATAEGQFTIPPARVNIDGQNYQSNSVTITVTAATATPPPAPDRQQEALQTEASARDLFIRASASNTNPFQGEQVIVTYEIFTRVSVSQYSVDKLPSYRGFWSENLTAPGQPQTRTQVVDGETYRVAEIRRVALFPQRSGELTIEPLEVEAVVNLPGQRRRQSLFDEFFGGSPFDQRSVRQIIKSNTLRLNVKPLPVQNRPAAFTGMVGTDFEISAHITNKELNPNDATNLRVTISGKGNMRMLEKPDFNFPANLEVFDPNVADNIRNTTSGVSGSRTFEYLMIPRTGGEFVIPPFQFVYFDPSRQQYITRNTPEFTLQVSGDPSQPGTAAGTARQEDIRQLTTDIRFIRTHPINLIPKGTVFYGSRLFYILTALPFMLFSFFLVYWRNHIKLQSNQQLLRNKRAEKIARKRLKKARTFMDKKSENDFYDEIFKALWGYLSDKLSIPVSILNKDTVSGAFKSQKVPQELSKSFLDTLNETEFARFAPGEKEDKMTEIYQKALQTIITIEKDLRSKKNGK
ncbi:MAG: protein BatD [Bacteroidetes bacterium]|nr:MAG: protein BatD [Bacteroidota bacterium]